MSNIYGRMILLRDNMCHYKTRKYIGKKLYFLYYQLSRLVFDHNDIHKNN